MEANRLDALNAGDKIQRIKPAQLQQVQHENLGSLLQKYSSANIRSYGVSGLSSISLRGGGSNHTAVIWEGINLQSITSGGVDVSLIPVEFMNDVSIQMGPAGALYGSGAVGGAIHLQSDFRQVAKGLSVNLKQQLSSYYDPFDGDQLTFDAESLGRFSSIQVAYNGGKAGASVSLFQKYAGNRYDYYNRYDRSQEYLENAAAKRGGIMLKTFWQLADKHRLSLSNWYQDNYLEVAAPISSSGTGEAIQEDISSNHVLQYAGELGNFKLKAKSALIHAELLYNSNTVTDSYYNANTFVNEVSVSNRVAAHSNLLIGLNNRLEQAENGSYSEKLIKRNRTALFGSWQQFLYTDLELLFSFRQEVVAGELVPFIPSFGANYQLFKGFQLKGKLARAYRIPTFNDLYWIPGGNPDLNPEDGVSGELGMKLSSSDWLTAELTFYSNTIENWIYWLPDENGVWTPVNVEKVWARGLEFTSSLQKQIEANTNVQLWLNYTFTKSTKEEIKEPGNPAELGKQLFYTPKHQAKASLNFTHKSFFGGVSSVFTGQQFRDSDNVRTLPHWWVTDIHIGCKPKIANQHMLTINVGVNNLFDQTYEVRNAYPMPGRYFDLTIQYSFNQ